MKTYDYIFYKIYTFTEKLGNYDVAFSAVLGLSFLLYTNLIVIYDYLFSVNKENIGEHKLPIILLGIIIIVLNYFIFIYKKRYLNIKKRFIKESKRSRIFGSVIVIIYVVSTFLLVFLIRSCNGSN